MITVLSLLGKVLLTWILGFLLCRSSEALSGWIFSRLSRDVGLTFREFQRVTPQSEVLSSGPGFHQGSVECCSDHCPCGSFLHLQDGAQWTGHYDLLVTIRFLVTSLTKVQIVVSYVKSWLFQIRDPSPLGPDQYGLVWTYLLLGKTLGSGWTGLIFSLRLCQARTENCRRSFTLFQMSLLNYRGHCSLWETEESSIFLCLIPIQSLSSAGSSLILMTWFFLWYLFSAGKSFIETAVYFSKSCLQFKQPEANQGVETSWETHEPRFK